MVIRKTHDYIHRYRGLRHTDGICRIEIFQEEGRPPTIICSELAGGAGSSVTGLAEYLAAEVVLKHFPAAFEEIGEPFVWIERLPQGTAMGIPPTYGWVTFDSYTPRLVHQAVGIPRVAVGRAHWTPIERGEIAGLITARRASPDGGMALVAAAQHALWEHEGANR